MWSARITWSILESIFYKWFCFGTNRSGCIATVCVILSASWRIIMLMIRYRLLVLELLLCFLHELELWAIQACLGMIFHHWVYHSRCSRGNIGCLNDFRMELRSRIDLLHLIIATTRSVLYHRLCKCCNRVHHLNARACRSVMLSLSYARFKTRSWLLKHFRGRLLCLLVWQNALIYPTRDLTGIIVWKVTFEGKLTTLGALARDLALRNKLRWSSQPLLYLLYLRRLDVNRIAEPMMMVMMPSSSTVLLLDLLSNAFAIFELLNFVTVVAVIRSGHGVGSVCINVDDASWCPILLLLLDMVDTRVALGVGRLAHVMDVDRIGCKQVHLVLTGLAESTASTSTDVSRCELEQRLGWDADLATFTRGDYACRMLMMFSWLMMMVMVMNCVNRCEIIVSCRGSGRELGRLMVVMLLGNVDLRTATCACRAVSSASSASLATVTLEQSIDYLLLAMVAINTVSASTTLITQLRIVSPLLGAGPTSQNRSLVDRTGFLVYELRLPNRLLKTLAVLNTWMLMVCLSYIATLVLLLCF